MTAEGTDKFWRPRNAKGIVPALPYLNKTGLDELALSCNTDGINKMGIKSARWVDPQSHVQQCISNIITKLTNYLNLRKPTSRSHTSSQCSIYGQVTSGQDFTIILQAGLNSCRSVSRCRPHFILKCTYPSKN